MSMAFSDSSAPEPTPPTPTGQGAQERDAVVERAYQEVFALCKGKRWTMHVPVEETDSDMVITAGLAVAEHAVTDRDHLRDLLRSARRYFPMHLQGHGPVSDLLAEIEKALGEG